ncbi:MAG: DJ-1 family glyoxalase III [Gammaproteobacteria bacterium]
MANVLVPLADGCEEIETITIVDLLRRAEIDVTTAALTGHEVTGSHDITIRADKTLDDALQDDYDMVVLPGGMPGADHLENDQRLRELLRAMAESEKFTAAICAAPKVLGAAGLLDGRRATSFPGFLDSYPVEHSDDAVVRDGLVITSRGPGTAMDFALALIEALAGKQRRDEVEGRLQRPHLAA